MCRAVSDDAPFPPRQFEGRFRASASPQLVICRRAQPGKLVQERHQHIASLEQKPLTTGIGGGFTVTKDQLKPNGFHF